MGVVFANGSSNRGSTPGRVTPKTQKMVLDILLLNTRYKIRIKDVDTTTRVQILDEPDCISHSTNTLGKGMNPNIRPPAMGK